MADDAASTNPDEERVIRGLELAGKLFAGLEGSLPLPTELSNHTFGHLFGDVWQGPDLELTERSLVTCTVLVALARENEQRLHFRAARNLGIERAKLEAMISHVAHYAGWPVAVGAARVLDAVWAEMDAAEQDT